MKIPEIGIEPGRSLVGDAGITFIRLVQKKKYQMSANIWLIDGGMTDNIRPALYQAKYEAVLSK